ARATPRKTLDAARAEAQWVHRPILMRDGAQHRVGTKPIGAGAPGAAYVAMAPGGVQPAQWFFVRHDRGAAVLGGVGSVHTDPRRRHAAANRKRGHPPPAGKAPAPPTPQLGAVE